MAIQKTQAILLSKKEVRQTSCIAHFYTQDFGKVKALIKGVRGEQAVFGMYLQEFSDYHIVYYEKKRNDVHTVAECDLRQTFKSLNRDLERRLWAYYSVELVDKLTPLEDKNSDIYWLLLHTLEMLDSRQFVDKVTMAFQVKFLKLQGLMPGLDFCVNCNNRLYTDGNFSTRFGGLLCGKCLDADMQSFSTSKGAVCSLRLLANTPLLNLSRISISSKIRQEISGILNRFIDYQLGEHLKSARFIRSVASLEPQAIR